MNVVSYCLFSGEDNRRNFYWDMVPAIVRAHHNIFPGWELWLHHDTSLYIDARGDLFESYKEHKLLKLIDCGKSQSIGLSALWRFKPLWHPDAVYMLSRDIDSLPLPKDRRAVEVFLQSGKIAHSITDHPSHQPTPMGGFMAGMCGFDARRTVSATQLPSWDAFVAQGENLQTWSGGPDQQLLFKLLYWPLAKTNSVCHHNLTRTPALALPLGDVTQCVQDGGDALTPFMGCPGFDIDQAVRFYDRFGHPEVADRIALAESAA